MMRCASWLLKLSQSRTLAGDEAFADVLKKHKQPVGLMASLKESVGSDANRVGPRRVKDVRRRDPSLLRLGVREKELLPINLEIRNRSLSL